MRFYVWKEILDPQQDDMVSLWNNAGRPEHMRQRVIEHIARLIPVNGRSLHYGSTQEEPDREHGQQRSAQSHKGKARTTGRVGHAQKASGTTRQVRQGKPTESNLRSVTGNGRRK